MTREELYGAVWTTPLSRLAGEYGISGNGLANICNRGDYPVSATRVVGETCCGQSIKANATAEIE